MSWLSYRTYTVRRWYRSDDRQACSFAHKNPPWIAAAHDEVCNSMHYARAPQQSTIPARQPPRNNQNFASPACGSNSRLQTWLQAFLLALHRHGMLRTGHCLRVIMGTMNASVSFSQAVDCIATRSGLRATPAVQAYLGGWQEAANAARRESGRCCSTVARASNHSLPQRGFCAQARAQRPSYCHHAWSRTSHAAMLKPQLW